MSRKYKFHNAEGAYFISFATVYWIDVFVREEYFMAIADSLDYCRKNKGMELYAYCILPSHVHMIFRDANKNPSKLIKEINHPGASSEVSNGVCLASKVISDPRIGEPMPKFRQSSAEPIRP